VRSLRRGTQEHRLEPKMLDVLLLLAEHEGRPVPRVDLERGVWSGAAVGTELLNRTVWKLRKALGDDPGDPTYIETIPRVGYRLVAPVRRDEAEAVASTSSNRSAARWVWTIGAVVAAAAMVVLALRRGSGGTGSVGPSAVHIVPLTATPGYEAAPALSPDGGRVAFQRYDPDSPSPTWDIAVVEIESSAVQPVAVDPDADEYAPAWSPDGDSLAFVRQDATSCAIMVQPRGGVATRAAVCSPGQGHEIAWDLDGSFVLASSAGGQTVGLVRVPRGGGPVQPLTTPPVGYDGDGLPHPSPDGTRLAFVRQRTDGIGDLYLLDVNGPGEPRRLTFDNRRIGGLAWGPGGRELTFSSNRGGESGLWRVSVEGEGPVAVPATGRNASRVTVGPAATVYEEYFGDSDVWAFEEDSGAEQPWSGSSRSEWGVTVSPSGNQVAFLSDRTGAAEVWVASPGGGSDRRLTRFEGAQVDPPRWSPDGDSLVVAAAVEGHFDVYVVPVGAGSVHRVTRDPGDERTPAWWGGGLVYSANRTGTFELWMVDHDGAVPRRLTSGGGWAPRAAADGSGLYFTRADEPGLWHLRSEGTSADRVWADLHAADWANWVEDASGLLYFRVHGTDAPRLEHVDIGTGASLSLAVVNAEVPDRAGVGRLADGRILFSRVVRSESDLWLATPGVRR